MATYDVGESVRLACVFTDTNGTATDPTTVTVSLVTPDGTETTPEAVRLSTGHYYVDVDTTDGVGGVWRFKFAGDPPLQAVSDSTFYVRDPGF